MNIYSTPADVQALLKIMNRLGLPPQKINVQYSGGAWNTHSVAPVDPTKLPERDIFSIQVGNQTNDLNVAASLAQCRDTTMEPFYRAWYLYMQFSGTEITQAEFRAKIEQTAAVQSAVANAVESILGGK